MSRWVRTTICSAAALGLLLALPSPAHAQGYTFVEVVDSSQGFDPFDFGCAAINNAGDVAIRATRTAGVTVIFVVTAGGVRKIADDATRFSFLGRNPSLNDLGEVSFAANLDAGGEAILRGSGGPLTLIAQTPRGRFNFFGFDTSVNDGGRVAFKAELDDFDEGLFSGRGGPVATHYLASTSPFGGDDSRPSINDVGEIAFEEFLDGGGSGIFLMTGGTFVTIADTTGPLSFAENPSLNSDGVVAFQASLDTGESAVLTGSGGPLTVIAASTGPFSFFGFDGPSLAAGGQVAFTATLDAGDQGLFVGPDPVADKVIATGDELAGSTVTNVSSCAEGLNDLGELVFTAQLADGRTGVFKAIPAA